MLAPLMNFFKLLVLCLSLLLIHANNAVAQTPLDSRDVHTLYISGAKIALLGEKEAYPAPPVGKIEPEQLRDIEILDLSNIPVVNLPAWMLELEYLRKLDLANTSLQSEELTKINEYLPNLEVLNLSGNDLNALERPIATELSNLKKIRELHLSNNALTVEKMGDFSTFVNLHELGLAKNKLGQNLEALGLTNLHKLRKLDMSENQITIVKVNDIPANSLIELDLQKNSLKSLEFTPMQELEYLDVSDNPDFKLDAKFASPFAFKNLTTLWANRTSELPHELYCRLQQLKGNHCAAKADRGDYLEPIMSQVIDDSFRVGIYEVTVQEWKACQAAGFCSYDEIKNSNVANQFPVEIKRIEAALKYVEWLKNVTGKPYRLPTFKEWVIYSASLVEAKNAGMLEEYMWNRYNSCNVTQNCTVKPVGEKTSSEFGLYDVFGNLNEVVVNNADAFRDTYGSEFSCSLATCYFLVGGTVETKEVDFLSLYIHSKHEGSKNDYYARFCDDYLKCSDDDYRLYEIRSGFRVALDIDE